MAARVLLTTWQEGGPAACARKLRAAAGMGLPIVLSGRRSARSVGAYFDLITDDGRLFYGDSFHLGYFPGGDESLAEALDAHTDLVAGLAGVADAEHVLDVGCGIGAPALRMASKHRCRVTGLNISREQVRQANELIAQVDLSDRISIQRADARTLEFPDDTFDAIVCLEVAGDVCVREDDKHRFVGELFRVLRPGGRVGFSDLSLRNAVSRTESKSVRSVLYHAATELVTDWPAIFRRHGFRTDHYRDILAQTLPTWDRLAAVYQERGREVERRYGRRLANRTIERLGRIRDVLAEHGLFPTFAAVKPR
jgi:cyclopropane fatty-acyl-phospholipid synthase-like methyltransferase